MPDAPIYTETQRLHQNAIVRYVVPISCLFSVGLAAAITLSQGSPGTDLALILAIGLGVPLGLSMLAMHTTVTERSLCVRTLVAFTKTIDVDQIFDAQAIRYNPLADCGGWGGPRRSRKYGVVYNMAGDHGVLVHYHDAGRERSMLIGSRRGEELERAIRVAANLSKVGSAHDSPPA